jgi:hypothetical protein
MTWRGRPRQARAHQPPGRPGWRAITAAMAALFSAAACDSPSSAAATRLYVYPGNPLFAAAALLKDNGHRAEAAELKAIAEAPSAF